MSVPGQNAVLGFQTQVAQTHCLQGAPRQDRSRIQMQGNSVPRGVVGTLMGGLCMWYREGAEEAS